MLISDLVVFEVRENSIGFDLKANIKPRLKAVNSGRGRYNHVILHHEFLKDTYIDIATLKFRFEYGRALLVNSEL